MPLELNEEQHVASAGESSADAQNTAALAGRWGDFMPIDQWTPPRITAQFKGLEFRRYNMSPETWIKTPDSRFGDSTPDTYERCFAGVQESIQELAAMLQHSQGKAQPPISRRSSATESVDEGKAVDDQVADGLSYNLRWNTLSLTSQSNQSTAVDHSTRSDDDAPAYDLGWGATVTLGQEAGVVLCDEDALAYDLGWGVTTAAEQPMQQDVTPVSGDADDGPVYDLGWGVNSLGEEPMEEDDDDGPSYDLGWGSAPSGEQLIPQDVIDPTNEGPSYDLGWGEDQVTSRCPSPLSPLPESSAPMDLDHDIRDSSPIHYGSEAEDAILRSLSIYPGLRTTPIHHTYVIRPIRYPSASSATCLSHAFHMSPVHPMRSIHHLSVSCVPYVTHPSHPLPVRHTYVVRYPSVSSVSSVTFVRYQIVSSVRHPPHPSLIRHLSVARNICRPIILPSLSSRIRRIHPILSRPSSVPTVKVDPYRMTQTWSY
ncbi:hypothetical protein DFH29DRAFT_1010630 [Suillus ampliporus]|nr:hypothetical protein DFH29DRAFT_1010630 [Suillus ampliporus]